MTDLAPWLTPALVTLACFWAGSLIAVGVVVLCAAIFDLPDRTTPEEDEAQMRALSAARRADVIPFVAREAR